MVRKSYRKDSVIFTPINGLIIDLPAPTNLSYLWNFGSLLGFCLLIQVVTGVFLAMHYSPDIELAFASVEHITRDINHGFTLRYLHANGASIFFLCVYFHIGRGIYYGSYLGGGQTVWGVGVIIYLFMIVTAFMGYVLPWGQMSFWAATVITNLLSAIPYVGEDIVVWVWGGFSVSGATLNRFFSLHYLFPFILCGCVIVHLAALHRQGSNNPLGFKSDYEKNPFHHYYALKDTMGVLILGALLCQTVFNYTYALGDVENYKQADPLVTPAHIKPEWYFLFVYAILRSIPNKFGGVVALVLSLLVLFLLPYLHRSHLKSLVFRPLGRLLFGFLVAVFLVLTWVGGQPVEAPFTWMGGGATIFYFMYFLVFTPLVGIWENLMMRACF